MHRFPILSAAGRLRPTAVVSTLALTLAFAVALSPRPAAAADEFSPSPMKSMMDLFGLSDDEPKPEIDYRERAPLVVPPGDSVNGALPPPQDPAYRKNPNWPKDPDVARRAREAAAARAPVIRDDPGKPLMPSELNKGRKKVLGVIPTEPQSTGTRNERLMPSELGAKSWFPGFGGEKAKPIEFTGEPARETLLQPPPGYQTPAPNAPYGVVEEKKQPWKPPTLFDRDK